MNTVARTSYEVIGGLVVLCSCIPSVEMAAEWYSWLLAGGSAGLYSGISSVSIRSSAIMTVIALYLATAIRFDASIPGLTYLPVAFLTSAFVCFSAAVAHGHSGEPLPTDPLILSSSVLAVALAAYSGALVATRRHGIVRSHIGVVVAGIVGAWNVVAYIIFSDSRLLLTRAESTHFLNYELLLRIAVIAVYLGAVGVNVYFGRSERAAGDVADVLSSSHCQG